MILRVLRVSTVVFSVSATMGACTDSVPPRRDLAGSLALHSGDGQGANLGQQLPEPLAVIAHSVTGEPMPGVEV